MIKIPQMQIKVPAVRINNGERTENIIKEQEEICQATTKAISKTAKYRKEREIREEYGRRLRICNDFLGMSGYRKLGCIYREGFIDVATGHTCEHVIPVAEIVRMLIAEEITFHESIFYPIALIKGSSEERIKKSGRAKSHFDILNPFKRYEGLEINIFTWEGDYVDPNTWSMDEHWKLVKRTPRISEIYEL